jgi:membrane fusion protein (multidrug efflux system)
MTTRTKLAGFLLLLAAAAAAGCSSKANDPQGGPPPVAVETSRATTGTIEESVELVGSLAPKFEAQVRAEYAGTVAEIYVTEWVPVKKGTPLARLDTRELEAAVAAAEAAAREAEAAASRADREYERAVKLKEAGLMTQQGLDDALSARDGARPAVEAARARAATAKTRLGKAMIRSPLDGIVASRDVSVGDFADKASLFHIVDNRLFDLTVTVPSGRIHAVRVGQRLVFETDAVPDRAFEGTVAFINPAADAGSRAVRVLAAVPNPSGELKAGLFVKGRIVTGTRIGVIQVPRTALVSWDVQARKADVFVVSGDVATRRSVSTGASAGDAVEIPSGLASGDVVVTRGAFNLKDGDRVAVAGTRGI